MQKFKNAIEKNKELILKAECYIWENPETGYKEKKTSQYLEEAFELLGYELVKAGDIPGFYTMLNTGRPGPEVLILGEMDALLCPEHPEADAETGAVHCCGHVTQCAALLGLAAALKEPEVLDEMCGKIRLCAVPAEELIEIEYRLSLRKEGRIKYVGGKTEFLHRGYFDGVDLAFMVHATPEKNAHVKLGSVGLVAKQVTYKGVAAHAGGNPWDGCNALYAATQGLSAVNAIRETFKDAELVRVHPIITQGGSVVNAIPDRVKLESFVRGRELETIHEVNKRVNRALCGGALSLGGNINIVDIPGYAPLFNDADMMDVAEEAWNMSSDMPFVRTNSVGTGSTDFGDLSCLMPVVHPYVPGAKGKSHGADYYIETPELACVTSALWQLHMLYLLLKDGSQRANKILACFKPKFGSKEEYLAYIDQFNAEGDCIDYLADGSIKVKM